MNKASFRFVVRRRDAAAGTFREAVGPISAGKEGRVGLRVERVENLYEFIKGPCQAVIYEVDGKGDAWKEGTELARFDVRIRREGDKFFFTVLGRRDVPSYENPLPAPTAPWEHWYQEPWKLKPRRVFRGPWAREPTAGFTPDWQPVHVMLDFNTAEGNFDRLTTIRIPASCRLETTSRRGVTEHFYSLGFKIFVGGELKFKSTAHPVDCHDILTHNLRLAAQGMLKAHRETIARNAPGATPGPFTKGTGTHYGSEWMKRALSGADQARFVYEHAKQQKLQFTSCMQYLLDVGEIGFAKTFGAPPHAAGARPSSPLWRRLRRTLPASKASFTTIAKELVGAGWISIYFNPDTENPHSKERADRRYHLTTARLACRSPYVYSSARIPVHDRLIDYRVNTDRSLVKGPARVFTAAQQDHLKKQLDALRRVGFGFIVTGDSQHGHCAILVHGKVHEVHWAQGPDDRVLFDDQDPLQQWVWGSGLIVVPRGRWHVRAK